MKTSSAFFEAASTAFRRRNGAVPHCSRAADATAMTMGPRCKAGATNASKFCEAGGPLTRGQEWNHDVIKQSEKRAAASLSKGDARVRHGSEEQHLSRSPPPFLKHLSRSRDT